METDEKQIRRVIEAWHHHTARGELDPVLDLMTEDAVFLTCGRAPMTRHDFAAGFRDWTSRASIESIFDIKEIHASGDVAYVLSYISIVMTSKDTGNTQREGHVLSVFRKSRSGKWQLARDANLMSPGKEQKA